MSLVDSARAGDVATCKQLLASGKDVNERGPNGVTALIVATEARNMELIKLLLAKGADRTLKYEDSKDTPMHLAARIPDSDVVELLLKNDDGSWNMDGAFTTRVQNTKGKFPEPPADDTGVDAEAIRDLFKEVLPTANQARKERSQQVWNDKQTEYQKSCSATMVGVL